MKYEHANPSSRRTLATFLSFLLETMGFKVVSRQDARASELVFSLDVHSGISILVFSTISGKEVRGVGKDAIRVVAKYRTTEGKSRSLGKADKRVNRVGQIEDILKRVKQRVEELKQRVDQQELCKDCGAPKFESKRGNVVCAEACWTRKEEQPEEKPAPIKAIFRADEYSDYLSSLFMEG